MSPERLLTDRASYISYLESQLDKVSSACLTVVSYDERLEAAVSAARALEERLVGLARLVSVTQQFAEQQERAQREGLEEVRGRLRSLEAAVADVACPERAKEWEAKLQAVGDRVEAKLQVVPNGVASLSVGELCRVSCLLDTVEWEWCQCMPLSRHPQPDAVVCWLLSTACTLCCLLEVSLIAEDHSRAFGSQTDCRSWMLLPSSG